MATSYTKTYVIKVVAFYSKTNNIANLVETKNFDKNNKQNNLKMHKNTETDISKYVVNIQAQLRSRKKN